MSFKTYEEYVNSKIKWIGEIPQHWHVTPLKRFVKLHNGKEIINEVEKDDKNAIGVYGSGGLFKYTDDYLFKGESVLFGRKGTLGKPIYLNDIFWTVDTMYYLSFSSRMCPKYCYYYLILYPWDQISTETAKPSVVGSDVINSMFAIPNIKEQQQIANYLDKQTAKIDATIAKNEELIELLEEKRVALINQVVTKGLNPNVPMKDSGVEWIGKIPEHWDVEKIKKYFNIHNGSTPKDNEDNWGGDICWVTPADYKTTDIYIDNSSRQITKNGLNSCGTTLVPKGSIIVSNRAPIGTVAIANVDLCTNQGCKSLAIKKDINTKFVYYILSINEKELNKLGRGTTFMELSAYDLGTFLIPIAPITEQKDIVAYLDKETSKIKQTVSKIKENITLLEEYKTSLIHHVVTGKIDVRGEEI